MRGVDAVTRKKKALEWLDRLEIVNLLNVI
ncbi:MAG: hypothetical protein CM15mP100_7890 [Alphaproteobacteria bacterium]|nr:MAG: hypothetical protein CM15mP100_7890 [Alphaproteobacteria bacterium]